MRVVTVEEMRLLDQSAVSKYGFSQELLMENAGLAVAEVIKQKTGVNGKHYLIFCGVGNNGGDGLVVARKIHSNGGIVHICLLGDPKKYSGSAALNWKIIQKLGITVTPLSKSDILQKIPFSADVIVDAIFGAGLDRDISGVYRETIEWINHAGKPVFSVDLPSGINGNSGKIMGIAVKADYTITFGLPKIGNMLFPGFEFGGMLHLTHISFPKELQSDDNLKISINLPPPLPPRRGDMHKGDCGKVLFIAGAASYYGAPHFAAMSFLKAGGGLSFLATPEKIAPYVACTGREVIIAPLKATAAGSLSAQNLKELLDLSQKCDMVVIGPGLSLHNETQRLIRDFSRECQKPLLIDGDGLTAIAGHPEIIQQRRVPTILTPHNGEMARLIGRDITSIDESRCEIVTETAQQLNTVVLLKGAHSLVGLPDGHLFINLTGNPGMATAGSGDVLTGTIAAAFGLGLPVEEAAKCGVFLHGLAGDLAATRMGQDGLTAGDILSELPNALLRYRSDYQALVNQFYGKILIV